MRLSSRVGPRLVRLIVPIVLGPLALSASAGAQDRIAFSSTRLGDGNAEVFSMAADGSDQIRLTHDPAADVDAEWSPDGSRLVFTRIAVVDGVVQPGTLWLMGADGSNQTQLTNGVEGSDATPTWSPDGVSIAFTRHRFGNANTDVYAIDADGTNLRRLTFARAFDGLPAWSPEGTEIVFTGDREGDPELYTMNSDGSSKVRITRSEGSDAHPAWSPDGRCFAFISERDGSPQVYVKPTTGAVAARRVTSGDDVVDVPSASYAPTWSPDGRRIAYTGDRNGDFEILVVDVDGGVPTALTRDPAADFAPDWQEPFGNRHPSAWPPSIPEPRC